MKFLTHSLEFKTQKPLDIIDISQEIRLFGENSGLKNALTIAATSHTTAALVINEKCAELQKDMMDFLTCLVPQAEYRHNKIAVDGRPNTHSHLLSLLMSSQVTLVLKDSKLQLGNWQSVFLIELDGPREKRKVNLSLMGE